MEPPQFRHNHEITYLSLLKEKSNVLQQKNSFCQLCGH
jgi:hypothetical protein